MSTQHIIKGLDCIIPGGISAEDLSAVSKIDEETSKNILDELVRAGIGVRDDDVFSFSPADKLKAAIFALKKGAFVEEVSSKLDWRDFEGLVAEVLQSKDFATIRNYYLKKPRMEIDVVGIRLGIAMLIDCKHWNKSSLYALRDAVEKQVDRTKHYVANTSGAMAVPVIVTLYQDEIDFIKKVPIVPISRFSSFVDEFYGNLDKMEPIESN